MNLTMQEVKLLLRCIELGRDSANVAPESMFNDAELEAMDDPDNAQCDPIWDSIRKKVEATPIDYELVGDPQAFKE